MNELSFTMTQVKISSTSIWWNQGCNIIVVVTCECKSTYGKCLTGGEKIQSKRRIEWRQSIHSKKISAYRWLKFSGFGLIRNQPAKKYCTWERYGRVWI